MIELIPAIDIIEGKCVRLAEGDFARKTVYDDDPVSVATRFADAGLRRLHIVDLEGAKQGRPANLQVIERIASIPGIRVDAGGGIKTSEDIADVFNAGAAMASIGSIAVSAPETLLEWIETFGGGRIFLGADVRNGMIAVNGWQSTTDIEVVSFLKRWAIAGVTQAFATDISRDGMLAGPAIGLYKRILADLPSMAITASGGVASMNDVRELELAGCCGVIIGRAIYEGRVTLEELRNYAG